MFGCAVMTTCCGPVASSTWMPPPALTAVNSATVRVSDTGSPEPTTMPPGEPQLQAVARAARLAAIPRARSRTNRGLVSGPMVASLTQRAGGSVRRAGPKVPHLGVIPCG